MQDIIKLLPESLANQIAAGEVVQRPASVVKELLENAVDAGASNITLVVKNAGKSLIQVIDDGIGMSETDARMCFERHATSKISKTDDLFAIGTFGFRGEAMASIAAVAQVALRSKPEGRETGIEIQISASHLEKQEPVACTKGTSVSVKNLFFNVPARRNFLKSNPVELRHIIEEFQRVALANPEINMVMMQDDLETFNLRKGKFAQRIVALLGKNYQDKLIPCQEDVDHVQISGYIGKPECSKKTRGEQFFFVNGRFIKHPYLHHALTTAYEGLLGEGYHPFYALNIEIDPKRVDVNVHPTKTEVKFDDERTLYGILLATVRQSLAHNGVTPSLDFRTDVNFSDFGVDDEPVPAIIRAEAPSQREANNKQNWEKLFTVKDWDNSGEMGSNLPNTQAEIGRQGADGQSSTEKMRLSSAANDPQSDQEKAGRQRAQRHGKFIQVGKKFIVSQVKSGLMLVEQQAAHERILFERFQSRLSANVGASQRLLFPVTVNLSPADFALFNEVQDEIRFLGFDYELFSGNSLMLKGIPSELDQGGSEGETIEGLLEQLKWGRSEIGLDNAAGLSLALAKRASVKTGQSLEVEEMSAMFEQLFACSNPHYSPDGRKIVSIIGMDSLNELFL